MQIKIFSKDFWKGQRLILLAFLVVHSIVAAINISYQDITNDEGPYYVYGVRWAHGQVDRIDKMDDSKSPVTALSILPRSFIQLFNPSYSANDNGKADILSGRYLLDIYTWIIAFYFFSWCTHLYDKKVWMLPMIFFLFDPMVLSYSMLIISDMAVGACVIATLYHLYRFYKTRFKEHYLFFSLWLGLGCVAKPSFIFMVPCVAVLYLILILAKRVKFHFKKTAGHGLVAILIILLVINLAYFFKDTFLPFGEQQIRSKAFQSLITNFEFLKPIPIPFPKTYFDALDLLQYHKEIGGGSSSSSYPGVYLNGETKLNGGFWYYYIVVAFYKLPLPTLLLTLFTIVSGTIYFNKKNFLEKGIWYVWPAFFFLFLLSFANTFQIGLRHVLMFYPLIFLAIAGCIFYWQTRFKYTIRIGMVLLCGMITSVAFSLPDLIPYTNELVTDKKMVYKLMNDGNIDYGQALKYIPEYIHNHPGVAIPTEKPSPGKFIVSIQQMLPYGALSPHAYNWLLHFEPVDNYKSCLLIFDISKEDIANAGLTKK